MSSRSRAKGAGPLSDEPISAPTSAPSHIAPWRTHARRLLLPWTLALLAYLNSFGAGFVYDNRVAILDDSRVHALTAANLHAIWTQDTWGDGATSGNYRPLTNSTYLLNYAILGNGTSPFGYHCFNLLLHLANILLLYLCCLHLFNHRDPKGDPAGALALAAAALFSVHPLLTETVTNIVGRADMLAAFGILAGLLCHIRAGSATGRSRTLWLTGVSAAVAIGIFSKENAVVVLAAMLLYDLGYRPKAWRSSLAGYVAACVPLAAFFVLRYVFLSPLMDRLPDMGDNPLLSADFLTGRATALLVLGKYLWLLVFPVALSPDYSYNQIPLASWTSPAVLAPLAICIAIAALTLAAFRTRKHVFFFAAFFLVALAPVANIFILIGTIMGERLLYLPVMAFAACLAVAIHRFARHRYALPAAVGVFCTLYAARTFARNRDWHDEISLWSSAAQVSPGSYRVHDRLAYYLTLQSPPDASAIQRETDRTVAILDTLAPRDAEPNPYINAAAWYRNHGDPHRALALLQRAASIVEAKSAELVRLNRAHHKSAVATGDPLLHAELARTYSALGDRPAAAAEFQLARQLRPDPAYSSELAAEYLAAGDWRAAALALLEGLLLDPDQTALAAPYAEFYRQNDPTSCAISNGALNTNCPAVHEQLCQASRTVVQIDLALGRTAQAASVRALCRE
uniref:Tetratricopeptide TPR_2 repeat protein n=1 Tax=Solibacter usitatus (strain Ellin6076) TaxID=234267 RepID=Q01TY2_SOLUE